MRSVLEDVQVELRESEGERVGLFPAVLGGAGL